MNKKAVEADNRDFAQPVTSVQPPEVVRHLRGSTRLSLRISSFELRMSKLFDHVFALFWLSIYLFYVFCLLYNKQVFYRRWIFCLNNDAMIYKLRPLFVKSVSKIWSLTEISYYKIFFQMKALGTRYSSITNPSLPCWLVACMVKGFNVTPLTHLGVNRGARSYVNLVIVTKL